jgi:hypothetical protein
VDWRLEIRRDVSSRLSAPWAGLMTLCHCSQAVKRSQTLKFPFVCQPLVTDNIVSIELHTILSSPLSSVRSSGKEALHLFAQPAKAR